MNRERVPVAGAGGQIGPQIEQQPAPRSRWAPWPAAAVSQLLQGLPPPRPRVVAHLLAAAAAAAATVVAPCRVAAAAAAGDCQPAWPPGLQTACLRPQRRHPAARQLAQGEQLPAVGEATAVVAESVGQRLCPGSVSAAAARVLPRCCNPRQHLLFAGLAAAECQGLPRGLLVLAAQVPKLKVLMQHQQLQMRPALLPAGCVAADHWRPSTSSSSACSCPWLAAGLQREQGLPPRRRPVLRRLVTADVARRRCQQRRPLAQRARQSQK